MNKKSISGAKKKGKMLYVRGANLSLLQEYAERNGLDESDALNQLLSEKLRGQVQAQGEGTSQETLEVLSHQVDALNTVIKPALLELLETSGYIRAVSQDVPEAKETGARIREQFSKLFHDNLELQ